MMDWLGASRPTHQMTAPDPLLTASSYLPNVHLIAIRLPTHNAANTINTFPSPSLSPLLSTGSLSSHSCRGRKVDETIKLVIPFKLIPIALEAVRAGGGITSDRTTHVTGPVPSPKAKMKRMRQVADNVGRSELSPMARPNSESASRTLQKTSRLREPVRYYMSAYRRQYGEIETYGQNGYGQQGRRELDEEDHEGDKGGIGGEYAAQDAGAEVHYGRDTAYLLSDLCDENDAYCRMSDLS